MNQLFVRVVLLCAVVVCILYFIKNEDFAKKIKIKPLAPDRNSSSSYNRYDVLLGSSRNLSNLAELEMKLATCHQQTGLIETEINTLQNQITEKKQQSFISCQAKLKQKLDAYKRLYKSIHNVDIPNKELLELENKIGIDNKI
jgi:peptidoglycan hydrolase CwlO-like protein